MNGLIAVADICMLHFEAELRIVILLLQIKLTQVFISKIMVELQNGVAFDRPVSLFIDSGCSTDPQVLEFIENMLHCLLLATNLFL